MNEPPIEELIQQLRTAKTAPGIALITAKLLNACGVHNFQQVGQELCRVSVTSGLGRN